jgi:hypothetical protein
MTDDNYTYPCPRCQVGHCQRSVMPYLKMYGDTLVNVPEMPVWSCDICGFYEFEREVLTRVDHLISGGSAPRVRGTKSPANRTPRRVKP